MKKTIIILLLAFASMFSLQAQTLVLGNFSPVPSNYSTFQVTLFYTDASTTITSSSYINSNGYFMDTVGNNFSGTVTASYVDCYGNTISSTATYTPSTGSYDFGTLDYCANANTTLTTMGTILNAPLNSSVNLSYDYGMTFTAVALNASGAFTDMVTVPSGINYVIMNFTDCNGTVISDSAAIAPALIGYIASFANADYCNTSTMSTTVSGSFLNLNGFLYYSISLDDGLTYQSYSVTPNGAFNEIFNNILTTSGMAILQYVDCNGVLVSDTAYNISISPNQEIFDFGNIDFCPTTSGGTLIQITGQFSPNAGIVGYDLFFNNTTISGFTDSTGVFYLDSVAVSTMPTEIYISFTDCNGNIVMDTAYPSVTLPFPAPFDFGVIDFCPTVNPPIACTAGFATTQNIIVDSFGNVVVAQVIMIQNTSTGQNLSYAWDFGDGSPIYNGQHFTHTYANAGPYVLCLTVSSPATPISAACSATYCDSLMVDSNGILLGKTNIGFTIQMGDGSDDTNGPTGINTLKEVVSNLSIYPNPTSESFTLAINANEESTAVLKIYDLTGKLMKENQLNIETGLSENIINVENLNQGIYLVQIKTENGFITKKLSIRK